MEPILFIEFYLLFSTLGFTRKLIIQISHEIVYFHFGLAKKKKKQTTASKLLNWNNPSIRWAISLPKSHCVQLILTEQNRLK